MPQLLDVLAHWREFAAIVVGDFMLDELVHGDVDRIANDAPVPVMLVHHTEQRPGGAANVCLDLAVLKARVWAVGVSGDDSAGRVVREHLTAATIDPTGIVCDSSRPTTVKRSLIGLAQHRHAQKMFRMDYESREPLAADVTQRVLRAFDSAIVSAKATGLRVVACIEDYAKGVCTPEVCQGIIKRCKAAGIEVLVDPAAIEDYSKYAGCTTVTPNRAESELACTLTGEESRRPARIERAAAEDYADVAAHLVNALGLDAAVVTLDRHGALLLERGGEARAVPTTARKVYDVTGAGDMVLAALAAGRANGMAWFEAVRFANAAAGLEVEEVGVVPIPLARIHRDILQRERATIGKLRTLDELKVEIAALRQGASNGKKPAVVFTNGCFDVPHVGHTMLLRRARQEGDFVVVAINTDEKVKQFKGPNRPVNDAHHRAMMLSEFESVDAVVIFSEDTPLETIVAIRPDVLVKGDEYAVEQIPGAQFVIDHGGRVVRVPMKAGLSTTGTLKAMNDPRAATMTDAATRQRFVADRPAHEKR